MNKKLGMILGAALLAIPVASFAATYDYVNVNGQLATVNADSAAQALMVSDLGPHSGVMLVTTANTAPTTVTPTTIQTGVTGTATSTSSLGVQAPTTVVRTPLACPIVTTFVKNSDGSVTMWTKPTSC